MRYIPDAPWIGNPLPIPDYHEVTIVETLKRTVCVPAKIGDYNDAVEHVRNQWENGEIILTADDFYEVNYE